MNDTRDTSTARRKQSTAQPYLRKTMIERVGGSIGVESYRYSDRSAAYGTRR